MLALVPVFCLFSVYKLGPKKVGTFVFGIKIFLRCLLFLKCGRICNLNPASLTRQNTLVGQYDYKFLMYAYNLARVICFITLVCKCVIHQYLLHLPILQIHLHFFSTNNYARNQPKTGTHRCHNS